MATNDVRETQDKVTAGKHGTFPVTIDFTAPEGERYQGVIEFRPPTVMDTMRQGTFIAKYLQQDFVPGVVDPALIPPVIVDIAEAVVAIEMYLVRGPEWAVKVREQLDPELPLHIHRRYLDEKAKFRGAGKKPATPDGGGATGETPVLVPEAVQPSAD